MAVSQLTVGDPFQEAVNQGPLINEQALEKVRVGEREGVFLQFSTPTIFPIMLSIPNPLSLPPHVTRWSITSPMQCLRVVRSYWAGLDTTSWDHPSIIPPLSHRHVDTLNILYALQDGRS